MPAPFDVRLDPASDIPLYKQLAAVIEAQIAAQQLGPGDKLPPTRELAVQLGLNRTTVSAAYAVLEDSGLIEGHVGRGSFVAIREKAPAPATDWNAILPPLEAPGPFQHGVEISFATSRPAADGFPLSEFRRLSKQVIDSPEAQDILQLGSPHGYQPLRRYLLDEARKEGVARAGDDLMITNGCQQALDLLARLFAAEGRAVVLEDPVYHGLIRVFSRAGANIVHVPVDEHGLNLQAFEQAVRQHRPRLAVITPSFQNPTGATLALDARKRVLEIAHRHGTVLVESDIYSDLRYRGQPLPTLKQLDESGDVILVRSYSKIAFPGLRVGWVVAPRSVVARLAEAKQISDLHSDQLSQAVLLRFAESGELARHLNTTRREGALRLSAVVAACRRYLPPGARFTEPEGGMNLWIELPSALSAEALLNRAQERGVSFLPGKYFSASGGHVRGLRISFGGLSPEQITRGIRILGEEAGEELASRGTGYSFEPVPALV